MPAPQLRTTNASWTAYGTLAIPADAVSRVVLDFFASDHAGDAARWKLEASVRREGDGAVAYVGILNAIQTFVHKTAGAAAWDVRLVLGSTAIALDVKGGLATTVDWLVENEQVFSMEGSL